MKTFVINTEGDIEKINNYLAMIKKDGSFKVEVKRNSNKRSLKQNSLYWLWLSVIGTDTGYSVEELHAALRAKFLTPARIEALGMEVEELPSTTKLTVAEFGAYLQDIEILAADIGIPLPHPEDLYFDAVYGAKKSPKG